MLAEKTHASLPSGRAGSIIAENWRNKRPRRTDHRLKLAQEETAPDPSSLKIDARTNRAGPIRATLAKDGEQVPNGWGVNALVGNSAWGATALVATSGWGDHALVVTSDWADHALMVTSGYGRQVAGVSMRWK